MTPSHAAEVAWLWTERALAIALAQQTIELLLIRRAYRDDGIFRYATLKPEIDVLPWPLRVVFVPLLRYRVFLTGLWLRLLALGWLLVGDPPAALVGLLLLTQLAIGVRFRGTFNGGSDTMTTLLLLALWCSRLSPSTWVAKASLLYVAVQLTWSYVIAGIAKLRQRDWWSGAALRAFVETERYGAPSWAKRAVARVPGFRLASWSVLAFECGFPLAWWRPEPCVLLLATGFAFHLGTWLLFGLNRFVFAWLAAYPAMIFASAAVSNNF